MLLVLALIAAAAPVTPSERLAAARAAGFTVRGATVLNECDSPAENLTVERRDLNGDGAPELVVSDEGGCYGGAGATFTVLRRSGVTWAPVLSEHGVMTVLATRHAGWADIEIGGPGMGRMPVARWNGTRYVH